MKINFFEEFHARYNNGTSDLGEQQRALTVQEMNGGMTAAATA